MRVTLFNYSWCKLALVGREGGSMVGIIEFIIIMPGRLLMMAFRASLTGSVVDTELPSLTKMVKFSYNLTISPCWGSWHKSLCLLSPQLGCLRDGFPTLRLNG